MYQLPGLWIHIILTMPTICKNLYMALNMHLGLGIITFQLMPLKSDSITTNPTLHCLFIDKDLMWIICYYILITLCLHDLLIVSYGAS